jgi:hypothetical protein
MNWKINSHTRGEIDRAGDVLRDEEYRADGGIDFIRFQDYLGALSVMEDWRASHAFPLNTFQITLRRRAKRISRSSEVFQRMKRAHSVVHKLKRFPNMRLSRMQDLGGCRAILPTNADIEDLRHLYLMSRDRHGLSGEKNYVEEPRDSGYRGRHLIYKYQSDRNELFNNHRIEIQLRSRIQHYWATAVEVAGLFVQSPLKSSIGPGDWLQFFQYASSCFSIAEGTQRLHAELDDAEILERTLNLENQLGAFSALRRFSASHNVLHEQISPGSSHFVLTLDIATNSLSIESFRGNIRASERYAELEKKSVENPNIDVVLVAAENIESLARGYPNYFSDTEEFIDTLNSIFEKTHLPAGG